MMSRDENWQENGFEHVSKCDSRENVFESLYAENSCGRRLQHRNTLMIFVRKS